MMMQELNESTLRELFRVMTAYPCQIIECSSGCSFTRKEYRTISFEMVKSEMVRRGIRLPDS